MVSTTHSIINSLVVLTTYPEFRKILMFWRKKDARRLISFRWSRLKNFFFRIPTLLSSVRPTASPRNWAGEACSLVAEPWNLIDYSNCIMRTKVPPRCKVILNVWSSWFWSSVASDLPLLHLGFNCDFSEFTSHLSNFIPQREAGWLQILLVGFSGWFCSF